jgi:hypothetical protein
MNDGYRDPELERVIREQIHDAFVEATAQKLEHDAEPLVESLAELLGPSPAAWRGVTAFVTGLFNIADMRLAEGAAKEHILVELLSICQVTLKHPRALNAAIRLAQEVIDDG